MIEKATVTAALLAVGVFASLGYTAIAQQTQPSQSPTEPTTSPTPAPTSPTRSPSPTSPTLSPSPTTPSPSPSPAPTTSPTSAPTRPAPSPSPRQTTPRPPGAAQPTPTRISATDRQFTIKAAQGGMGEVILGKLAAERAVSDEVKQYGQMLVEEHTKANNELKQLAARKGVTLPKDTDAKHKALRARLGQIPGRRFDRTFIREMVADHANTVSLFQRQERQGQDPDLKDFATKHLPTIEEHLQMARQLRSNTAVNSTNSSSR